MSSTYTWRPAALPDEIDALIAYGATDDDCDLWMGTTRPEGYGYLRVKVAGQTRPGKPNQAHRLVWEVVTGKPIPGSMNKEEVELDHLCRNPRCVKPAHLEPVPKSENLRRRGGGK